MSAKAATLEAQVKTLEASGQPVVDVWSPRSTQFRVQGGSADPEHQTAFAGLTMLVRSRVQARIPSR